MSNVTLNRPRPAHFSDHTQMTSGVDGAKLVTMGTIKPWKRVEFFLLLRTKMVEQNIPNLTRLAELAGLSPSTLSNWQNGKQRPTPPRLSQIADVIGMKRRDLWAVAGVLDDETEGMLGTVSTPADSTIQMIRESRLTDVQQDRLIENYLAEREAAAKRRRSEERAEAAEREQRMRATVEMLETATIASP